jgi:long-chain acyl-CoA synthetase
VAEPQTLPQLLRRNARERGARPAFREKDRGIWQSHTWQATIDHVRDFALGLAALGFRRGEVLSVIGDNRPRLYWAQLAAQALGGVAVPVYQDSIARELAFVWNHAEVAVIVAEDQEQVDKILALRAELPALRGVVYDDPRGLGPYRHEWLRAFADVQEVGRKFGAEHPGHFEAEVDRGRSEDVAFICYTSGTTGVPKGAMLTHRNVLATAAAAAQAEDIRPTDDWLAYLPMAWIGDAFYTLALSLYVGFTVNCPESPETVQRDLRELGPSVVLAPPRIWENMLTSVQIRAAGASPLKALGLRALPSRGRAGRGVPVRGPPRSRPAAARVRGRDVPGLRAGARPARAPPRPVGAHRRRPPRRRHLPLLPGLRDQPQTGLRVDGGHRPRLHPAQ